MNRLSLFHPLPLITYFISVGLITMFTMNPFLLAVSLLGSMAFFAFIAGKEALKSLAFYIPMFLIISITNPLFNHKGATPLLFLNGNAITAEAVIYGIALAAEITAVMLWCTCYNRVVTSDKLIHLIGRAVPKLSLVICMALRFVPMFIDRIKRTHKTQMSLGLFSGKGILNMINGSLKVFSAVTTEVLENAVETGNSMKARGYGLPNRTDFSLFKFEFADAVLLCLNITAVTVVIIINQLGLADFYYYPKFFATSITPIAAAVYLVLTLFMFAPFILIVKENLSWKYLLLKN